MEIIIKATECTDTSLYCNDYCMGDGGACKDSECRGDGQQTDDCQIGA